MLPKSCSMNFSVLCAELRKVLPLLPNAHRKIAGLVAPQATSGAIRSLSFRATDFSRLCESGVIEFAQGVARGSLAATQLISRLTHSKPDHAVVAAVVAVDQLEEETSSI